MTTTSLQLTTHTYRRREGNEAKKASTEMIQRANANRLARALSHPEPADKNYDMASERSKAGIQET